MLNQMEPKEIKMSRPSKRKQDQVQSLWEASNFTEEQTTVIQVNAKAKHLLYNAICSEVYEKISSFETAKEIWDKLEVTYEGTNKVKETRINLLGRDYELFQMKYGELVEEIFSRFSKILGDLKYFGRPIRSGE
ncbi:uncharacterized protein [Nicotiana tomentosiformis]|uniref:uncharacterized protein n=1 Tax=Nicotiana tomentosiformis TaxID=4098 RepID=UPI00388C44E1